MHSRYKISLLITGLLSVLLTGCERSMADIEQSKLEMKAEAARRDVKLDLPLVPEARQISYITDNKLSPFAQPEPTYVLEAADEEQQDYRPANCLRPDGERDKQPLERYALDSLIMRGVIGNQASAAGQLWALIDSGDGNMFRVGPGQYLGLDHGRIVAIDKSGVELIELVRDGTGCWQERLTKLALLTE